MNPWGESWVCLAQVLFIDLGGSLQIHHLIVWILHWAVETTTLPTAMYFLSQGGCDKKTTWFYPPSEDFGVLEMVVFQAVDPMPPTQAYLFINDMHVS